MNVNAMVWGGQVSSGLRLMKKSRVEDVRLSDLQRIIADFELERMEIKSKGGATSTSSAPRASRLVNLDNVIDDLTVLEDAVRSRLGDNA